MRYLRSVCLRKWIRSLIQVGWTRRGIILRAILCWLIGVITFWSTQSGQHDWRFRIRNIQKANSQIVLVEVTEQQWRSLLGTYNQKSPPGELFISQSDQFFWNPEIWTLALQNILKDAPKSVGISLLFSDTKPQVLTNKQQKLLQNPRVIWAATLDSQFSPKIPYFVDPVSQRQALINYPLSDNGIVRYAPRQSYPLSHMSEVLVNFAEPTPESLLNKKQFLINYVGLARTYKSVNIEQVVTNQLPIGFFQDKIVIIGTDRIRQHQFLTPLGLMNQSEIIANTADTLMNNKVIRPVNSVTYVLLLAILVFTCLFICLNYPHELSAILLFGLALGVTSFSFWQFDSYYFWLPILAPLSAIVASFVLFLSMQLTLKENQNWRLEQEKKYLFEVRQLKENFVSLISHDLKTPIAKIQAIIDRMKQEYGDPKMTDDLLLLRQESAELNRYIQSILKILRVEARDFKLNKDACDINKVIETVTQQLKPLSDAKMLTLDLELEPMFLVDLDQVLIREVILNIIENAIKYSQKGTTIRILSTEVDDQVIVVVEDGGAGISKEEQQKIFDKFHRGKEHSFNTKGSGLGLYLVKYFIELHGGEVFLESEMGKGTTVGFSLPVHDTEQASILEPPKDITI